MENEPPRSWLTIAVTVVALLVGAEWAVSTSQFSNVYKAIDENRFELVRRETELKGRVALIEAQQLAMLSRLAHDPVEDRTFQAVAKATDDRINLLQNQISDINRQIAAALIIIDNNAGSVKRIQPTLPP